MRYLLILSIFFISCGDGEDKLCCPTEPVTVKEYLQSNIFYYQDTYQSSEGNSLKADWFFDYVISGDNFYIHNSYNDINDINNSDCYFDGTRDDLPFTILKDDFNSFLIEWNHSKEKWEYSFGSDGTIIYKNVGWSEYIFKVSSQETWNSFKQRVPNKC